MANPTTNYSFAMPTNTDLVKDLPADFEVFGQAVDTQMKTNADAAIAKSLVTTKGDLIAATGASTPARLAVGTNDYVLTADSTASAGVAWKAASSGSMTSIATGSLSGVSSVTISSISGSYKNLMLYVYGVTISPANQLWLRWNGLTSTGYAYRSGSGSSIASGAGGQFATKCQITATSIKAQQNGNVFNIEFPNYAQASMNKTATWIGGYWESGDNNQMCVGGGTFVTDSPATGGGTPTGAITSITLLTGGGTFGAGDYILYGVN